MLTCEICGMEILLEEDMKTHLLLFHLENDHHCPLCGLSGVSYDELCFHITSAHPEDHQGQSPKSPNGSNARKNESKESKTNRSLRFDSSALADKRDLGSSGQSGTENLHLSPGESDECTKDLRKQVSEISDRINPNEIGEFRQIQNSPEGEKLLPCPMCTLVYSCPYLLQEHVELHLLEQESDSASEMCSPAATSTSNLSGTPGCDLRLAEELQHQEELKRRQEEARLEREEFKKLQRQYGLDGRGGYRRQMERSMERAVASGHLAPAEFHLKRAEMMERLASGIDDGSSRTQGIIQALKDYYQAECRDCVHVWLSADTDHYSSSAGDTGWGCGYRNFQMLLSSLHRIETYSSALQEKTVPCIPRVQRMIQEAWKEGLDPQGASHFNHQLERTEAWIGATEIYVLLTSLGLRGRIIDFHQPTGSRNTHPQLFDWVKKYFCPSSVSNRLSPRLILTSLPPLYLQHQGHSRTVVGLEQRKNGNLCLLLLDPASSPSDTRKLLNRDTCCTAIQFIRKFPRSLKHKQYQLVAVEGVLSSEEKEMRILSSRNLCAERIP